LADEPFQRPAYLISIRKTSEDLDRLEEMVKAAKTSYTHAVWSAAQYTVEVDAADAKRFHEHLEQIRAEAERAANPEDWPPIQASFREELHENCDRSTAHLAQLRAELKAAAEAMEMFAADVASNGADHKQSLREALEKLDSALQENNLALVRPTIVEATAQISAGVEQMEHAHQFVIAQLLDEIGSLHRQIDVDRRAQFLDDATGVWNRRKLDSELQQMLAHDESFCLLAIGIRNRKWLEQHHSPAVIAGGIKAMLQRFSAMMGENALLGRWDEEVFAAILQIEPAAAMSLSREAAKRLSGSYSVQENGTARSIQLQAAADVIDRQRGADSASFEKQLLHMSEALSHA
jgi:GGDEF domain-containing protein